MSADVLYSLSDLALDAVGLLDVLEIDKAHIWGSSLGGMVAQTIAIEHPERVASLISVQATTGEADVGQPDPEALNALLATFGPADSREAAIANAVTTAKVLINNEAIFDEEYQRDKASAAYDRSYSPEGSARQAMAVMGATDRASALAALSTPALVIHGNRDPLIDISGGRRTAELIAGAQFVEIDGMGHDLSRNFWSQYVDAVVSHVAASESKGT
jgi:pimeloyl-ACP methyl ester carboxylesterase